MMLQLMSGLKRLHELGVGHRDMSLENILYDGGSGEEGAEKYVIIDFGMCLRLKYSPPHQMFCYIPRGQVCGKKNYIAPEIFREDPVYSPLLCDIWAVGIILFICLTGKSSV